MPSALIGRAAVLLAVALAAGAAPAGAQAPSPPSGERAAARQFSFAAYRLRVAMLHERARIEAGTATALAALDAAAARPGGRRWT